MKRIKCMSPLGIFLAEPKGKGELYDLFGEDKSKVGEFNAKTGQLNLSKASTLNTSDALRDLAELTDFLHYPFTLVPAPPPVKKEAVKDAKAAPVKAA